MREDQKMLEDTADLKRRADRLTDECTSIAEKLQQLIDQNARVAQDQTAYLQQYDELAEAYKRSDKKLKAINEEIRKKESNGCRIKEFVDEFERMPSEVTEFNDSQ